MDDYDFDFMVKPVIFYQEILVKILGSIHYSWYLIKRNDTWKLLGRDKRRDYFIFIYNLNAKMKDFRKIAQNPKWCRKESRKMPKNAWNWNKNNPGILKRVSKPINEYAHRMKNFWSSQNTQQSLYKLFSFNWTNLKIILRVSKLTFVAENSLL